MGMIRQGKQRFSRNALKSSASVLSLAAGAVGWSGLAHASNEKTGAQLLLLPEHYELMENGVVVFKLETGENLSLTADQYLILEDGLLLITDELAQASMYSLPVMGSVRADLLSELQPVRSFDGSVVEARGNKPVWSGEGDAPRLSEQVAFERFELAQAPASEGDGSDGDESGNTASMLGLSGGAGALALLGMLMTSDQPEAEEAEPPVEYWKMFDIYPGRKNGAPESFAELNGVLYFEASDDEKGGELWKYDPDTGTTSLVADIEEGSYSGYPNNLTVLNGVLYFSADDGTNGIELWKYDPTDGPDGTASLVDDIKDGSDGSEPKYLTVLDGVLYFSADDGTNGKELWKYDPTDGPDGATSLVDDIREGSNWSNPGYLTVLDGVLYFSADDGQDGDELWKYDPTDGPDGTTSLVDDIKDGSDDSYPEDLTVLDGVLYFSADDGTNGNELWKYDPNDGPDGTTSLVHDIRDGSGDSYPDHLTSFDGALYFSADDGTNGHELWKYDGTTATMVADAMPGEGSSYPSNLTAWQDKLWLELDTPSYDDALYTLDGDGLSLFKSFTDIQTENALVSSLVAYDGAVYFSAQGSVLSGEELWKYDPDTGTASLVDDIYEGPEDSELEYLTELDGVLYFSADDGTNGSELWKYDPTDGPDGATSLVDDIRDGSDSSAPSDLTVLDGVLYFSASDGTNGYELWKYDPTDGPDGATSLVYDIRDGSDSSAPSDLTVLDGVLYFSANDGTNGSELWKYDPTDGPDGATSLVDDIRDGSNSSGPSDLTVLDGVLYFSANDDTNGYELWKYDPTDGPDGTTSLVDNIRDGSSGSEPDDLIVLDGVLYFSASDGTNGIELWKYDPNDGPDGTASLVDDIRDGSSSSQPLQLTVLDGVLYFSANDGTNGSELWKYDPTDGPDGATSLVDDILDGSDSSAPRHLTVLDGVLYFSADDGIIGQELWTYAPDTGVSQAVDVNQTTSDDLDVIFAFGDDYLVVQAETHEFGEELWIYNSEGWL